MASRLFDRRTRERVWLLYAWCRACDDLADGQDHGGAPNTRAHGDPLATIRDLTARALRGEPTGEPAFDALGVVAAETGLTAPMAEDVIAGFALDAAGWRPRGEADTLRYCYHVAGAVGVMMAVVMGVDPTDEQTLDRACDLGIAFQLANIARDVAEDHAAGRCYLPGQWLDEAGIPASDLMLPRHREALAALIRRLCDLERRYEASGRSGAHALPLRQRWAVLSAAGIYGAIARKVERAGAEALERRVSTGAAAKLGFVARGLVESGRAPRFTQPPVFSRREISSFPACPELVEGPPLFLKPGAMSKEEDNPSTTSGRAASGSRIG